MTISMRKRNSLKISIYFLKKKSILLKQSCSVTTSGVKYIYGIMQQTIDKIK